jgi:hypothetical protein
MPGDLQKNLTWQKCRYNVGDHQELANLAAIWFLISAYVNGEVVVIDGGEWLKGAGQFNMLKLFLRNFGTNWK